ncbi:MAG: aldehyde dehydrogenase family protein, partial [Sciscionella sp.]
GLHPGAGADASWGPMTMPSQVDVVRSHVEAAIAGGGQAIVGGVDSVGAPFIEPVVIVDAPEDSIAVRAETFGPTLTVRTVADVDEAVRLANDTEYGLASSVFSANSGMAIARRISAGATAVNSVLSFAAISALPFGGQGESGFGRMHGAEGLREFSRPHSIARQRFAIPGMALLTMRRNKLTVKLVHRLVKLRHARPGVR